MTYDEEKCKGCMRRDFCKDGLVECNISDSEVDITTDCDSETVTVKPSEDRLKFISYDGKFPNLCSGTLVISLDNVEYSMDHCLCSGGSVWFDDEWREHVESGAWTVLIEQLPEPLKPFFMEIEQLVNENVEWGCCGGCV